MTCIFTFKIHEKFNLVEENIFSFLNKLEILDEISIHIHLISSRMYYFYYIVVEYSRCREILKKV